MRSFLITTAWEIGKKIVLFDVNTWSTNYNLDYCRLLG